MLSTTIEQASRTHFHVHVHVCSFGTNPTGMQFLALLITRPIATAFVCVPVTKQPLYYDMESGHERVASSDTNILIVCTDCVCVCMCVCVY